MRKDLIYGPPWFTHILTLVCHCLFVTHTCIHGYPQREATASPINLSQYFPFFCLEGPRRDSLSRGIHRRFITMWPCQLLPAPGRKSHHIHCSTISISRKVESVILYFVIWLRLDAFYLGFPANPFFIFLVRPLLFTGTTMYMFTRQIGVNYKQKYTVSIRSDEDSTS